MKHPLIVTAPRAVTKLRSAVFFKGANDGLFWSCRSGGKANTPGLRGRQLSPEATCPGLHPPQRFTELPPLVLGKPIADDAKGLHRRPWLSAMAGGRAAGEERRESLLHSRSSHEEVEESGNRRRTR